MATDPPRLETSRWLRLQDRTDGLMARRFRACPARRVLCLVSVDTRTTLTSTAIGIIENLDGIAFNAPVLRHLHRTAVKVPSCYRRAEPYGPMHRW